MPSPDEMNGKIKDYVSLVCKQIRWKKARTRISEEMAGHIEDGRNAYMEQGMAEQDATAQAITDTGDAMIVGTQLDRIHRPRAQWGMFGWIAAFLLIGILISVFFERQDIARRLQFTAVGAVVMVGAYFADFTLLGKYPKRVFCVAALLVWMAFVSPSINIGQWSLHLFGLLFHTRQVLALVFPAIFAPIIFTAKNKGYMGMLFCLAVYGVLCLIAFSAPALSGLVHFAAIGMILLIIAVMKNWFGVNRAAGILLIIVAHMLLFAVIVFFFTHEGWLARRLEGIFNPHSDPFGAGFLTIRLREIFSGAVLLGEGSMPEFFPAEWLYSDFILAAMTNRFGWLAFAVFMGALLFFSGKAVMLCGRQRSGLGFFVSIAIALTFIVQMFMYVIFNFGFLFTQISLPFISPGNFAMVVNMGLAGFMLSVFRTGGAATDSSPAPSGRQGAFISWNDGKLTIDFSRNG